KCFDSKGSICWRRMSCSVLEDGNRAFGIGFDVNDFKNFEEYFILAFSQSNINAWIYDINSHCITNNVNEIFDKNLLTVMPEDAINSKMVHPADIQKLKNLYQDVYDGMKKTSAVIRFLNPNFENSKDIEHKYIWLLINYTNIFGPDGKAVKAIGSSSNITNQILAEQKFREESAYHDILVKNTVMSVWVNITQNIYKEVKGVYSFVLDDLELGCVDTLFNSICSYFPKQDLKKAITIFNRKNLLEVAENGKMELDFEHEFYSNNERTSTEWLHTYVRMMKNPVSNDLEAFIYAVNIDESKIRQKLINDVLLNDYDVIMELDFIKGTFITLYSQSIVKFDDISTEGNFNEMIKKLCNYKPAFFEYPEKMFDTLSIEKIHNCLLNNSFYTAYIRVNENGNWRRKKIQATYVDKKKGVGYFIQTDITEAFDEEQRLNNELSKALIEAKKASLAKSEFLSNMSHEIRTPLNGVKGMIDLIQLAPNAPEVSDYLNKASISAKYLASLINDILDMSKIESGKLVLHKEWVIFADFKNQIDAIITPQASEHKHKFSIEVSGFDTANLVFIDCNRLKQVCINILSNSVKYTNDGGEISMKITVESIPEVTDRMLFHFIFVDNGIGMSEEFVEHAFDPFVQESAALSRKGTGLGLSIVKNLLKCMGTDVKLESKLNKGTKVYFSLEVPIRIDSEFLTKIEKDKEQAHIFKGKRVLIAEDNEINMVIAKEQFKKLGLEVETAENGKIAVEQFKKNPINFYNCIFMDIMMPEMNGYEATECIRKLERNDAKNIPIIAMTANAFAEDIKKSLEIGMNGHLSKPFEIEQLYRILDKILN
ncbi:MAG: response regulator, partial [Treponema sp.]|nr:response regulator [Treponema sp.]